VLDFVYDDFVHEDFVTEAPIDTCDFVAEDFVNTDFSVCVTPIIEPSSGGGIGGFVSRYNVVGYRGSLLPPYTHTVPQKKPKHIVIEVEPEKITDTLGKRIEELVITKPEPIPIYIDFIPVRKTINKVKLVEPQKPEYIPKPDIIKGPDKKKAALRKKLEKLKTLLDLTFIEHYI
jgi:hypothetical protein